MEEVEEFESHDELQIGLKLCQECYDSTLISAWEAWDAKNESDNDNPKVYPADQEVVSSGKLFSFKNTVVRILTSLCLGILMKQGVCYVRGNILLRRECSATLQFILEGKKSQVQAFGLLVSIIDFNLSKINTGEDVLFLDLSSNPEPLEGPKGNKQANTYRKMREVTDKSWEGR
ncbi:Non-specific serine/threonine protein kinase [Handroanthus impetiginosus]|uniref:Non-specific serine/threonine protein kinase n=1 Tax=Handroanthus impetiginosus TaxID=429701 RepID=A0A2G9FWL5_9LAMI|nr:Non-specific serine/threonine protein kinase [Handroanthus impetiginosus]